MKIPVSLFRLISALGLCLLMLGCSNSEQQAETMEAAPPATNPADNLVLVTGITGAQGGGVAKVLLDKGYKIRGLSRNIGSEKSLAWMEQGVEMVQGNFDDPASIDAAVAGIDYLFLNITERGSEDFVANAIHTLEAAVAAGAKHVVFSSTITSNPDDSVPGQRGPSKKDVEIYLRGSELPYSTLRVFTLMENFLRPGGRTFLEYGIADYGKPGSSIHYISGSDMGIIIDGIIQNQADWLRREVDLGSDYMTYEELASLLTDITGKQIAYKNATWDEYRGPSYLINVSKWLDESGHGSDVEQLRQEFPEMTTLEQFLRANGLEGIGLAEES